jgi:iron complex outermembrane receptor protein
MSAENRTRLLLACLTGALLCAAPPLFAEVTQDPASDEDPRVLPDVIVTAQKTEQTLQNVPASVSTIDGDLIRGSGAFGFPDLAAYSPNLSIRLTPVTSDIYIRGFGTASTNAGFEPSVASVIDGVYYGRSTFLSAFFNDIDRIEVLRGPQGTLFGKNSSAGVMNLVTTVPDHEFLARAELLYGDFGERSWRPVLNVPAGNDLAFRLSGNFQSDDGLLHNTLLNRPEYNISQETTRLRAHWTPGEPWTVDFSGFFANQRLNNNVFQLSKASPDMLAVARRYDTQAEASALNFINSNNVPSLALVNFRGLSSNVEYDLGGLTGADNLKLTSISAYGRLLNERRDFDADFSPIPFIRVSQIKPSPFTQWSQELRLSGSSSDLFGFGDGVTFVAGVYGFESSLSAADLFLLEDLGAAFAYLGAAQSGQSSSDASAGTLFGGIAPTLSQLVTLLNPLLDPTLGATQSAITTLDQKTRSYAVFGQMETFVTPHWALITGLRVGREHKSGLSTSLAQGSLIPLIADQKDHVSPLVRNESELSPKLGVKWALSSDLNVFSTWSRGFKGGGFNALALNDKNLDFGPERATSWELGTKARLLRGSMRFGATLFSTDFDDLQVSTFRNASFIILNAAAARSQGLEMDMNWLPPIAGTALTGTLGYTNARYTSYPDAPAPADAPASATCLPVIGAPIPLPGQKCVATQDLTGKQLPITPRWSATLIPSYTGYVPYTQMSATFAVDVLYRGARYLDVDLDPHTLQKPTTEVNTRLTFATLSKAWQMTLAARNLTKQVIYEQVIDQPLAPGNFAAIRADRGRFYSANVAYSY